jgi:hypothetical protein
VEPAAEYSKAGTARAAAARAQAAAVARQQRAAAAAAAKAVRINAAAAAASARAQKAATAQAARAAAQTNTGKAMAMLNKMFPPAFTDATAQLNGNPNATAAGAVTLWAKYLDAGNSQSQMHTALLRSNTFKAWVALPGSAGTPAGTAPAGGTPAAPTLATGSNTTQLRAPKGFVRDGANVGGEWIPSPGNDLSVITNSLASSTGLSATSPALAPLVQATATLNLGDIPGSAAAASRILTDAKLHIPPGDQQAAISAAYDAALNRLSEAQFGNWSAFNPTTDVHAGIGTGPGTPGFGAFATSPLPDEEDNPPEYEDTVDPDVPVVPLSPEDLEALEKFGVMEEDMPTARARATFADHLEEAAATVLTVSNDVREGIQIPEEELMAFLAAEILKTARPKAESLVASMGEQAFAAPVAPPKAWFEDPKFTGVQPIQVRPDGYISGHLATWDACHMESAGLQSSCVRAPRSSNGYAGFHLGYVTTAEGVDVPTGRIVAGAPHADPVWGLNSTLVHYSHSGWVGADVRVGEDRYGIWIAGAVRPEVSPVQLRALKGSPLSGDWRTNPNSGRLDLVAALAVNSPGFQVPRLQALVASTGAVESMQAVGLVPPQSVIRPGHDGAMSYEDLAYLKERAAAGKSWSAEAEKVWRAAGLSKAANFMKKRKMTELASRVEALR